LKNGLIGGDSRLKQTIKSNKMPLKKGKSKKVISNNIEEIMHSYHEKGTIGTSSPESNEKAQKQAIAIAFNMAKKKK
jgi:hypothetical protein